jgi:hypothetical protein
MKVNKAKRFDYTPRYYDERKERIEKIKKAHANKGNEDSIERQSRMRDEIQTNWSVNSSYSKQSKAANIRLIVILILLLVGTYFILDYVDIFSGTTIDLKNP